MTRRIAQALSNCTGEDHFDYSGRDQNACHGRSEMTLLSLKMRSAEFAGRMNPKVCDGS
jgi:hypothetical protein